MVQDSLWGLSISLPNSSPLAQYFTIRLHQTLMLINESSQKLQPLEHLIHDFLINGRAFGDLGPFNYPPNHLIGHESLGEVKTPARTDITPHARATKFQSDVLKRVRDIDLAYPGSTFEKVLNHTVRMVNI
jgi:hypothetical protein